MIGCKGAAHQWRPFFARWWPALSTLATPYTSRPCPPDRSRWHTKAPFRWSPLAVPCRLGPLSVRSREVGALRSRPTLVHRDDSVMRDSTKRCRGTILRSRSCCWWRAERALAKTGPLEIAMHVSRNRASKAEIFARRQDIVAEAPTTVKDDSAPLTSTSFAKCYCLARKTPFHVV